MLVIDQVKRGDARLRLLGIAFFTGFAVLLTGLWYVQIVSRNKYEASLKVQSYRTVRVPAARGHILDRQGQVLADNQPRFNVNLFLEDIRSQFTHEYTNRVRKEFTLREKRSPILSERRELEKTARYRVVSNLVWQVSAAILPQPLVLNPYGFERHYSERRSLPMTLVTDLTPQQIALFVEKAADLPGIELEVEPYRFYPHGSLAAHALGYVQKERNLEPEGDDTMRFDYRLPAYEGITGLEGGFENDLQGQPGAKAILVNNVGYRQSEQTWLASAPGKNIILTLDLDIQKAAERALAASGSQTRGAVVVLDCQTGDVLAMASAPAFDLNMFVRPRDFSTNDWNRLNDSVLTPQYNRALQGAYHPGSTFKMIVALAAFEAGVMDLQRTVHNPGYSMVGRRRIRDDNAPIGDWAFVEAFKRSANTYFIHAGLNVGADRLIEMGRRFNLGERTGLVQPGLEDSGYFPSPGRLAKKDGSPWMDGDTANLSLGQGEVIVTPLQMAVATAAIANGGRLLRPRLVLHLEDQARPGLLDPMPVSQTERELGVQPRHLEWIRKAMLEDVEDQKFGTGKAAYVQGMRICGKTGTAQVHTPHGMDHITWFVSFAPFDAPRHAVVVMIESGTSGGGTCAPKARDIYKAIQRLEALRTNRLAANG